MVNTLSDRMNCILFKKMKNKNWNLKIREKKLPLRNLSNLSKINIFIGTNNSGKSRFMREIVEKYNYDYIDYNMIDFTEMGCEISANYTNYMVRILNQTLKDQYNLEICKKEEIDNMNDQEKSEYSKEVFELLINFLGGDKQNFNSQFKGLLELSTFRKFKFYINTKSFEKKVYIPTLRGSRPLLFSKKLSTIVNSELKCENAQVNKWSYYNKEKRIVDQYKERTLNDYSSLNSSNIEVFTGLSLFYDIQEKLLGTNEDRKLITEFQEFLKVNFFDNKEIVLIPKHYEDVLTIKIESVEQPLYFLGDGIQAIINLMYPIFINKDKSTLFFIEEPELYLHPGLQRQFIEVINSKLFKKAQFFITTHSNHFLDLTLEHNEISIFKFTKEVINTEGEICESFNIENTNNEDITLLEELGVKDSSVFLSNCTVWVEGITDTAYLRKYIQIYQESEYGFIKYKEDVHYSFVLYGGNNITQWSFLKGYKEINNLIGRLKYDKLSKKIFVVADKDNSKIKEVRFSVIKNNLGIENCSQLTVREMENLLTKDILIKVIRDRDEKIIISTDFEDVNNKYENEPIGEWIDKNIDTSNSSKKKFSSKSGTVNEKIDFCRRTVKFMNTKEDISIKAYNLAKKIVSFIEKNN